MERVKIFDEPSQSSTSEITELKYERSTSLPYSTSESIVEIFDHPSLPNDRIQILFDGKQVSIQKIILQEPFKDVSKFLKTYNNKEQAQQVRKLISIIKELIGSRINKEYPEIDIFEIDDGSLGLQWDVGKFRFGAGLETNYKESYWFITGGTKEELVKARGTLADLSLIKFYLQSIVEQS